MLPGGGLRSGLWAILLACGLAACAPPKQGPPLAARVNGEPITVAQWNQECRFLGDLDPDGTEALDGLIDQVLILQEGRRLGLTFGDADRAKALAEGMDGVDPALLDSSLKVRGLTREEWQDRVVREAEADAAVELAMRGRLQVSDQEVQDGYWEHLLLYRRSPRRVLRQIFTRTRPAAEGAMRELEMGDPFSEVAAAQGQGPEAAQGGLLGPVSRDELPKALIKAAWALKPGTYSPIVASHWGYHILYLESLVPGDPGSLEEAAPAARAALLLDKEQVSYRAWLARLREAAVIERTTVLEPLKPAPVPTEKGMS
ncbi:MAG TPA: peptidyl-prolyl cis-trans isomerase [bacterium]|nr:peptidyl-prolyl cis-trans isomerase [bacterium]